MSTYKMSISAEYYSVFLLKDHRPILATNNSFEVCRGGGYELLILNHHPKKRADAIIFFDDEELGRYRINAGSKIVVKLDKLGLKLKIALETESTAMEMAECYVYGEDIDLPKCCIPALTHHQEGNIEYTSASHMTVDTEKVVVIEAEMKHN